MNRYWPFVLLVVLVLVTSACGTTSLSLPSPGVYVQSSNSRLEMTREEGGPPTQGISQTKETQPILTIYLPGEGDDVLSRMQLVGEAEQSGFHDFDVVSSDNGVYEIRPTDPLAPGVYCLVLGGPLVLPSGVSYWCFEIIGAAAAVLPTPAPTPIPGGATTAPEAVTAALRAIEANNASAYLNVIDPPLRAGLDNYFFFSQFLNVYAKLAGLGGNFGQTAPGVTFRDLVATDLGLVTTGLGIVNPSLLTLVHLSGFVQSSAIAERHFEELVFVRPIGDRWFISVPDVGDETWAAEQNAYQNAARTEQLAKQPEQLLAEVILRQGELAASMLCREPGGIQALLPNADWLRVVGLGELGATSGSVPGRVRLSPDGSRIAWAQIYDYQSNVGVIDVDGRNNRVLLSHELGYSVFGFPAGPRSLNWAPDGRRLVVVTHEDNEFANAVLVMDVASGSVETVWKGVATDAIFMPDGQTLLLSYATEPDGPGVLAVYDPFTGSENRIANFPDAPQDLAWNPAGTQLAFGLKDGVWVMDADGSNRTQVVADSQKAALPQNPKWSADGAFVLFYMDEEFFPSPAFGLARSSGEQISAMVRIPPSCEIRDVWWANGSTPAVQADVDLYEQKAEGLTVELNLAQQVQGLRLTLKEFHVTNDRIRAYVLMQNTGEFGKVFVQPTELLLYVLTQADAVGGPNHHSDWLTMFMGPYIYPPLTLTVAGELPSVLPVGQAWEGWLETGEQAWEGLGGVERSLQDVIGAVLVFKSFEFEQPYDSNGNTKVEWDTTQEGQEVWYQPLR